MARTNVEESYFSDILGRRSSLIQALTEQQKPDYAAMADGLCLRAFRLSQKFWKDDQKLIPDDIWAQSKLEPLIGAGLAERTPNGIYVKGTKDNHDWILQRENAGKKSAEKRKLEREKQRDPTIVESRSTRSNDRSTGVQPPLSSLPSLSHIIPRSLGGNTTSYGENSSDIPPLKKLTMLATQGAARVISALYKFDKTQETEAKESLSDIWDILLQRYPGNTWANIVATYKISIKKQSEHFFQKDLKEHFEAFLPIWIAARRANSNANGVAEILPAPDG